MNLFSPALRRRLIRWFPLGMYADALVRYRAVCTYILSVTVLVLTVPIDLALATNTVSGPTPNPSNLSLLVVNFVILWGGAIAAIVFTRTGQQALGGVALLGVMTFAIAIGIVNLSPPVDISAVLIAVGLWMYLAIATLLMGTRGLPLAAILAFLGLVFFAIRGLTTGAPSAVDVMAPIVSLGALFLAFVGVNWLQARGQSEAVQRVNLEAAGRTAIAAGVLSLTQRGLARLPLKELLAETAKVVRDSFVVVDTVQLWLVDPARRSVILSASTDRTDPLQRQVGVGSLDVVGRVAIEGRTIVVRDTPSEQPYRRSALPSGVLTQLAVPLKIASEVIGVLVAFSGQADTLVGEDATGMQELADQIAISVENARLSETIQSVQAENRRLTDEVRASEGMVERLNQQLTGQAWREYLRGRSQPLAFTLDLQSGQVDNFADWTDSLAEAGQSNQIVTHHGDGLAPPEDSSSHAAAVIALPIAVRGQAVGAVEFELEPGQALTSEQIGVIQQVVERMGLSADNARLFEEAQRLARREALIGAIGTRLQSAASVETVLIAAAQNLAEALNASQVAIRVTAGADSTGEPGFDQGSKQ